MKNKIKITIGGVVFALALALNIQFAMDGYGIDPNNVIAQVMAQTGGTGGDTGGGSGGGNGGGTSGNELCSATVDCDSVAGDGEVSCKGYDSRYTCKSNFFLLWVECDNRKHYCCSVAC